MLTMQSSRKPEIHVTESDRETLERLAFAARSMPDVADELLNELDRAKPVEGNQAKKYIGIGSTATFETSSGDKRTVKLVMPADADISSGRVSILTPIGVALLGLSEGQSINWKARDGRTGTLSVLKIHHG